MREEQSDDESAQEAEEVGEERDQEKRDLSSDAEIIAVRTTSNMKKRGSFIICCCKNNWKSDQDRTFVMILDQTSKMKQKGIHQTRRIITRTTGSIFGSSHIAVIIVMLAHS